MKQLSVIQSSKPVYPVYLSDRTFLGFVYYEGSYWHYQTAGHNYGSGGGWKKRADAIKALVEGTCKHAVNEHIRRALVKEGLGKFTCSGQTSHVGFQTAILVPNIKIMGKV